MILATTSAGCAEMQKFRKIRSFIHFGETGDSPNTFNFYFQHNSIMKIQIATVIVSSLLLLSTFQGCAQKVPADMPKLYSCTLMVTQDNKPLEGATIALFHQDTALQKWTAGGLSDQSGKVVLKTQGRYNGVVEGKYKITVTKTEVDEGIVTNTETQEGISGKTWTLVEQRFSNVATTPLTLEVTGKIALETIDVGSAVRLEMRSN